MSKIDQFLILRIKLYYDYCGYQVNVLLRRLQDKEKINLTNDSKTPLLDVTQVHNIHEEPELDLKLVQYQQKRIEELENELEKRKIKRSKVYYCN